MSGVTVEPVRVHVLGKGHRLGLESRLLGGPGNWSNSLNRLHRLCPLHGLLGLEVTEWLWLGSWSWPNRQVSVDGL